MPPPTSGSPGFDLDGLITKYAGQNGLDPNLVRSVIHQESGGNPRAVSPAGAVGLMQLMPGTAAGLGVDPTDPEQNIAGGTRYLAQQIRAFGDVPKGLAAYNAGPGAVKKYGGVPPFPETQNYVRSVLSRIPAGAGTGQPQPGASPMSVPQAFSTIPLQTVTPPPAYVNPYQDLITALTKGMIANGTRPLTSGWTTPIPGLHDLLGLPAPSAATTGSTPNGPLAPQPTGGSADSMLGLPSFLQGTGQGGSADTSGNPYAVDSPLALKAALERRAAQVAPNQFDTQTLQTKADLARATAGQDYIAAHPISPLSYSPLQMDAFPQMDMPAVPTRPTPSINPIAGILSLIAGAAVPHAAGQFAAAPVQAGLQVAGQQYGDRQSQYEQLLRQKTMEQQNAIQAREDAIRQFAMNTTNQRATDEFNTDNQRWLLGLGVPLAEGQAAGNALLDPATGLPMLSQNTRDANTDLAGAGMVGDLVSEHDRQQAIDAANQLKMQNLVDTLLKTGQQGAYNEAQNATRQYGIGSANDRSANAIAERAVRDGVNAALKKFGLDIDNGDVAPGPYATPDSKALPPELSGTESDPRLKPQVDHYHKAVQNYQDAIGAAESAFGRMVNSGAMKLPQNDPAALKRVHDVYVSTYPTVQLAAQTLRSAEDVLHTAAAPYLQKQVTPTTPGSTATVNPAAKKKPSGSITVTPGLNTTGGPGLTFNTQTGQWR